MTPRDRTSETEYRSAYRSEILKLTAPVMTGLAIVAGLLLGDAAYDRYGRTSATMPRTADIRQGFAQVSQLELELFSEEGKDGKVPVLTYKGRDYCLFDVKDSLKAAPCNVLPAHYHPPTKGRDGRQHPTEITYDAPAQEATR